MPQLTSAAATRGRDPLLNMLGQGPFPRQQGGTARPDFDSIMRAAPAYDDEDEYNGGDAAVADETDPPTASTSYLTMPPEKGDLTTLAQPHLAQHASLHAFLDANYDLSTLLRVARNQLHVDTGKLASRASEAKRLERVYSETSETGKKAAKKIFWTPGRRKAWRALLSKAHADHVSSKEEVDSLTQELARDREKVEELEKEMLEFKRVEGRLDTIDDMVFGPAVETSIEEKAKHRHFHFLHEVVRRLQAAVQLEVRAQKYLDKALSLCNTLTKELLKGLHVGVQIGVPTNTKHKTGLWRGTSTLHTSRASRGLVLRAKTLSGDMHTQYIQARATQRRVRVLPTFEVISPNRLPGMNAKDVVDELGLHRSLETSYAQAKIAMTHIEHERRRSKERQKLIKVQVAAFNDEARQTWLQLREIRRELMRGIRAKVQDPDQPDQGPSVPDSGASTLVIPPPYRHHLPSSSTLGAEDDPMPDVYSSSPNESQLATVYSGASQSARPAVLTESSFRKGARGLFAEARANEERVQARQRRRYLAFPQAVRAEVDKESTARSRELLRNVYVQVGGIEEDEDVGADAPSSGDDDPPGLHLLYA